MKKLIFAVLVVLLAMLAVTCDSAVFPAATGSPPGQVAPPSPPPEPGYVTITINVAGDTNLRARALDRDQATTAGTTTDYEVAFHTATNTTVRSVKPSSGDWTENVPLGDYPTAEDAVMFAGNNGKVLLGVGAITNADGSGSTTTISWDTSSVTFTLTALTAGVTTVSGTSAFVITAPVATNTIPTKNGYPLFLVETSSSTNITSVATYTLDPAKNPHLKGVAPGTSMAGAVTIATSSITPAATGLTGSIANTAFKTTGAITINIAATSATSTGFAELSFKVPVTPINGTNGPGTWYIQGGIDNTEFDTATTPAGGKILLQVTSDLVNVTFPTPPFAP